ncbi:MAG: hypothetical protein ACLS6O_03350 [Bifidobacterium sp.]
MVCTTLNFAEKYLLKTEVRSVAGMSGGTSDAGTDFDVDLGGEATSEAIMPPVSIARYRPTIIGLQPDMPMSHCIDGRDDAVRARR